MRAILLAAGLGTRLRPITDTIPKCLVPINDKPLIDYWLEQLTKAGIEKFSYVLSMLPATAVKQINNIYGKVILSKSAESSFCPNSELTNPGAII